MFKRNDFGIWFRYGAAFATLPVRYVDPVDGLGEGFDEEGEGVEFELKLYVGAWESSFYRPTERDFEIEDVCLKAFGRIYHFDIDDVIELESDRCDFMEQLARAYDDHIDESRAEAYCD